MKSMSILESLSGVLRAGLAALLLGTVGQAQAYVNGWEGEGAGTVADPRTFVLTAKHDFVSTSDGGSHYAWGYSFGTDLPMQYPGPTLIVQQGDTVKVVLNNTLPVPVSIVFPGQQGVTATGGNPGLLTREAPAVPLSEDAAVAGPTYTFVADKAGHLPLPQRHQCRPAGRDGTGRRADRAADRLRPGHEGVPPQPQGLRATRHELRPRESVPAERDGPRHSLDGVHAGLRQSAGRGRYDVDQAQHVVHQRPQCAGHYAGRSRRLAADAAVQRAAAHAPWRAAADARRQCRARPASVPSPRQPCLSDRARWPRAGKRARSGTRPDLAGLHRALGAGPDHGPDLRVDRQGDRLGCLRHDRDQRRTPARRMPAAITGMSMASRSTRITASGVPITTSRSR